MRRTHPLVPAIALLLAGCAGEPEAGAPAAVPPGAGADSAADTAAAPALAADTGWVVRPTGAGGLRIGTPLPQLAPRLAPGVDTATISRECDYVRVAGAPDSLYLMVVDGRLVRIDVRGAGTPTAEGARVGDSEARILELYPGARREPHKYVDGSYLVAMPDAPADTLHRLIFETDGQRVTTYRAGVLPPVAWVEGCS